VALRVISYWQSSFLAGNFCHFLLGLFQFVLDHPYVFFKLLYSPWTNATISAVPLSSVFLLSIKYFDDFSFHLE
jgi:hypothetical protein